MLAGGPKSGDRHALLRPHRRHQRRTRFTPRHGSKLRGSRGLNADDGVRLEIGEKQVRTAQVAGSRFDVLAVLRLVGDGKSLLLRQMQFGTAAADG